MKRDHIEIDTTKTPQQRSVLAVAALVQLCLEEKGSCGSTTRVDKMTIDGVAVRDVKVTLSFYRE